MSNNRVPVGADAYMGKNPWNQESGKKKHDKFEKDLPKNIKKHRKQRAANGYSWMDWINFDNFIMSVVANAMLDFVENGHGYFAIGGEQMDSKTYAYPEGTLENYNATLGSIYYALSEYLSHDDYGPGYEDRADEAREAMMLFAENTLRWWD